MIERYSLTSLDDIPGVFGAAAPVGPPRFNIAPLQIAPVYTDSTMPVVVPPDGYTAWLTGPRDPARELLAGALAGPTGWRAEPVSTWVNSVDHDDPRCIEPLGNPAQGELF